MAIKKKIPKMKVKDSHIMAYDIDTHKWSEIKTEGEFEKFLAGLDKETADILRGAKKSDFSTAPTGPIIIPAADLYCPKAKIVTVVAEYPSWQVDGKTKSKKIECGRAAAQAAHAVSKLKISYALQLCKDGQSDLRTTISTLFWQPITTITLKARNTEELLHICKLVNAKNLHSVDFQDDNPEFYGTTECPMTAVAIGPYISNEFEGITDYLPLWKCACDPQG